MMMMMMGCLSAMVEASNTPTSTCRFSPSRQSTVRPAIPPDRNHSVLLKVGAIMSYNLPLMKKRRWFERVCGCSNSSCLRYLPACQPGAQNISGGGAGGGNRFSQASSQRRRRPRKAWGAAAQTLTHVGEAGGGCRSPRRRFYSRMFRVQRRSEEDDGEDEEGLIHKQQCA